jgi:DNA polymerase-3 subunit gamma/tau
MNDTFGHAYLFTGIRGTGKTTIAKIFARAINCLDLVEANPCNKCDICESILNNTSMDIIEMDAASNNSVDDIREINENVMFPPSNSKYKVYIIDEVHMLSKGAFNALLKTLEEPPEYVLFLLATTEANKIPDTILSRCQRYDLKRVTSKDIFKRLEYILNELEINYEDSALNLLISKSEGSVRDSLSILDQCLSYDNDLSYKVVVDILGIIETETLNNLLGTFIDNNINQAMVIVNDIFNEGKDIKQFVGSVLNHFRNLLIAKMHSNPEKLIASSDVQLNFYKSQSEKLEIVEILRILNIFIDLEKNIKWSSHGKILFEIAIVKIFNNTYDVSIEALMQRIKKLEEKLDLINIKGIIKSDKIDKIDEIDKTKSLKYETNESTKSNINFEEIVSKWNEVLKLVKKIRIKVYAFLIEAEPIDIHGNKIILKLDKEYKFHGDNLMKLNNKETVETILEKVFLKKLTIDITYDRDGLKKNDKIKSINIEEEIGKYFTGYDKVLEIKK